MAPCLHVTNIWAVRVEVSWRCISNVRLIRWGNLKIMLRNMKQKFLIMLVNYFYCINERQCRCFFRECRYWYRKIKRSYWTAPQIAPLIPAGPKTCYELTCPLPERHLLVSSLDEKRSLHVQVPSEPSSRKQLEDCRLLQSESSKHSAVVAVTDQNAYKDCTVVTTEITIFRAVTSCSLDLSAASVFRMRLIDSKDADSTFFRNFG